MEFIFALLLLLLIVGQTIVGTGSRMKISWVKSEVRDCKFIAERRRIGCSHSQEPIWANMLYDPVNKLLLFQTRLFSV